MPGSRFRLYERAGHFPHREEPWRFTDDLLEFVDSTAPARIDPEAVRDLMRRHVQRPTAGTTQSSK
jgi:hypothetical protein